MNRDKVIRITRDGQQNGFLYTKGEIYKEFEEVRNSWAIKVFKDNSYFILYGPGYIRNAGPECEFIEEPAVPQINSSYQIF